MTTTLRLVDGATEVVLRPDVPASGDPIVCEEWELTPPRRRAVTRPRPAQRGTDDRTAYHDDAGFRATLVIRDGAVTRHETVDTLQRLLDPASRPMLYIQRDGWLAERCAVIRGADNGGVTYTVDRLARARLRVTVQAVVPSGYLLAVTQSDDVLIPSAVNVGVSYPLSYPLAYTPGASGNVAIVTSGGTISTPPLLRVYGQCRGPLLYNLTVGKAIRIRADYTVPANSYLDIDVAARTVLLNGDPTLNYYSKLDLAVANFGWWDLRNGTNLLRFSAEELGAAATVWLYWTDRYAL